MTKQPINMLEEKDAVLFRRREAAWAARGGPRVGDYALIYGQMRRFTHDHGEHGLQTTSGPNFGSPSFFLTKDGYGDYSGSLDPCVALDRLRYTGDVKPGSFWFFHHDEVRSHNGITCELPCRVYEVAPEPKETWMEKVNAHLLHHYNTSLEILGIEITDQWEKDYAWDFTMRIADERQLEQRWGQKGALKW